MGRGFWFFVSFALVFCIPERLSAYTSTLTPAGVPVRWPGGSVHFELAGNPVNQSGISETDFYNATVRGLQRWERASNGTVSFDYWQGTDPSIYFPNGAFDGLSAIYFASNAKVDPHLSSNVLGLTQVWYDTTSGQILETDIVLNDRDFRFTTNPRDTSGFGSGNSSYNNGKTTVFIQNVITHELGHALGLSHSGGLQSTMLFMESPEQAHLGCDETVAIHALYPSSDSGRYGAISGTVTTEGGIPILGAHVLAISRRRGSVLATGLTDKNGRYKIEALEPGGYFLMAEPFFAGPQTLPSYYWNMKFDLCPNGQSFGRTVFTTDSDGFHPRNTVVQAGTSASAPPIIPRCRVEGGAAITSNPATASTFSAPSIYDLQSDGDSGFGAIDQLNNFGGNYYRLQSIHGDLEIHALSYSLYSPIRPSLTLEDSKGKKVDVQLVERVYAGDSGYVNYDSALIATQLPEGDYTLKVGGSPLDASFYPAGPISIDSVPFLLLTGTMGEPAPVTSIPDNARCLMEENFPTYSSPPGNPPHHPVFNDKSTGFCATVEKVGQYPRDNDSSGSPRMGSGPSPAAIVAWFFPYFAMAIFARILRRTRSRT